MESTKNVRVRAVFTLSFSHEVLKFYQVDLFLQQLSPPLPSPPRRRIETSSETKGDAAGYAFLPELFAASRIGLIHHHTGVRVIKGS